MNFEKGFTNDFILFIPDIFVKTRSFHFNFIFILLLGKVLHNEQQILQYVEKSKSINKMKMFFVRIGHLDLQNFSFSY